MADPRMQQLDKRMRIVRDLTGKICLLKKQVMGEQDRLEKLKINVADEKVLKKQRNRIAQEKLLLSKELLRMKNELGLLKKFLEENQDLIQASEYKVAIQIVNYSKKVGANTA